MRVAPIIARLEAKTTLFKQIAFASSLNTIEVVSPSVSLPVVFVHPFQSRNHPSTTLGMVSQERKDIFAVLIGAAHASSAGDPLEDARDEIAGALVGYEINGRPIMHLDEGYSGDVVEATPDYVLWRDLFIHPRLLRYPLS